MFDSSVTRSDKRTFARKKKELGLKQKYDHHRGDGNYFALTSVQVQKQSNVADISRLANYIVLRRNIAGRNSFIYLVQEDAV